MVQNIKAYLRKTFEKNLKTSLILGLVTVSVIGALTVSTLRKTVNIYVDGKEITVVTFKKDVNQVLQNENIEISENDKVVPAIDSKISNNDQIIVKKAVPVSVTIAGAKLDFVSAEDTISDMLIAEANTLNEKGINYNENDIVTPEKDTTLEKNMDIKIVQVTDEEVSETVVMPCSTSEKIDYDQDVSYSEVVQDGSDGEKKITYKVTKHDGKVVSKDETSQTPIKASVDKIVAKGGSQFVASRGSDTSKIKKTIYVDTTAYSGGPNCSTYTGRKAARNPNGISTIAVDPRVIPLGSLVYIDGYGKAVAADIGTSITGNKVDVYQSSLSAAKAWGTKNNLELSILAYPGEW